MDTLWDGEPPPTATHQVHKVIAGLRRRLPRRIETDGPGCRIRTDGAIVDVDTFTELTATPTLERLTEALALWRGPALAATEALVELRLAAGDAATVAVQLPALIAEHPLRETLRRQLMVALYRCGRHGPASSYWSAALTIFTEFGVAQADLVRHHVTDPGLPWCDLCSTAGPGTG